MHNRRHISDQRSVRGELIKPRPLQPANAHAYARIGDGSLTTLPLAVAGPKPSPVSLLLTVANS